MNRFGVLTRREIPSSTWLSSFGAAAVVLCANWANAGAYLANGSQFNLSTIRGTVATSSQGGSGEGGPRAPLHGGYGWEFRSGAYAGSGDIWWQMETPDPYYVSNYNVTFYDPPYHVKDFTIQTSLTGLPGSWTTQATITNSLSGVNTGSFAPVAAKFIRVDGTSFRDNSYGMILQKVRFTGPNNIPIESRVSIAQSTWNGGVASGAAWSDPAQAIDDGTSNNWNYGTVENPNPNFSGPLIVTLNGAYRVATVAITGFGDDRGPKDVDVYVSQLTSGNTDWVLARQIRNMPHSDGLGISLYNEYDLDQIFAGIQRVRFDVLANYGNAGQTYLNEVYVFTPIPEPMSMGVLAMGSLLLLRRRRSH